MTDTTKITIPADFTTDRKPSVEDVGELVEDIDSALFTLKLKLTAEQKLDILAAALRDARGRLQIWYIESEGHDPWIHHPKEN